MTESRQHGGIVPYLIVGGVLLALLAGSIYYVKHQARENRDTDTTTPVLQDDWSNGEDTAPADTTDDQPAPTEDTAPTSPVTEETAPAEEESDTATTTAPAEDEGTGLPSTGPSSIAATGPGDVVASLAGLAAVAIAAAIYVRSAHHIRRPHR